VEGFAWLQQRHLLPPRPGRVSGADNIGSPYGENPRQAAASLFFCMAPSKDVTRPVGEWKLMQNDPYSPLELYNLKSDPQEKTNVISKVPKIANDLATALRQHIQRGGSTPWQKP
jgi:hypothetical protein